MGNAASGEEGRHRLGYHVLRVKEGSPAERAGIRPFFDYIVGINGIRLNKESTLLQDQMVANEGQTITLDVYSTREQAGKRIEMVPTTQWGDGNEGLLGCSIRFCMFDAANDVVWHVLDVYQGSPAERAGLCAHSDYIVGTPYGIMRGEGDLYDLIEDNAGEPLRLYVYNAETDHVREVIIVPNYDWGGEGLLGCDVGYGYLHRLPRGPIVPTTAAQNSKLKRSPSLPYPVSSSQDPSMSEAGGYARNTMPPTYNNQSSLGAGSQDILAPTPRPTQPPTWLDPEQQEKLSNMTTPRNTIEVYKEEGEMLGHAQGRTVQGEMQQNEPPLLRFGKGNRPDAEDESDEEDFVPRHEPTSSSIQQLQQQSPLQQPVRTASHPGVAAGMAGLTIQGMSTTASSSASPPTSTAAAIPSPTQARGNDSLTTLSSPPGSNDADPKLHQHQQQQQQQHSHHHHHHHHHQHHPLPHPVMTRFQAQRNPGTTPPPSAAALESPFPQALLHSSYPNSPQNAESNNKEAKYSKEKQQQSPSPPLRSFHQQGDEEINFGDIPFGAGEVPNFASMMNRQQGQVQGSQQQQQQQHQQQQQPMSRREHSLGLGVRTKQQAEPEGRIPMQTVLAQAQSQSEEYRRAMEEYQRQFQ